jgi:hypothetical protein
MLCNYIFGMNKTYLFHPIYQYLIQEVAD